MRRFGIAGTARVSFGLYNSKAEIDQFVVHLNEVIKKLRQ
jgi:cysteine desulfurase/selenocysteine lyase